MSYLIGSRQVQKLSNYCCNQKNCYTSSRNHWIAQSVQAGIVSGYKDGSFRPDQKITRTEMTVMLLRAMFKIYGTTIPSNTTTTFEDNKDIPQWAKSEVAAAAKVGIVQGNDGNKFFTNAVATRAEAITVLLWMLEPQLWIE